MFRILLIFLLIYIFLISFIYCEAGWNDPNIVLVNHKWEQRIEDPNAPKPPPPYSDSWKYNDTTIIVLIASFRETRCKDTLFSFFSKAAHPNRVRIGVVQQNEQNDPDCHDEYIFI